LPLDWRECKTEAVWNSFVFRPKAHPPFVAWVVAYLLWHPESAVTGGSSSKGR
jgi:hypothetical protein